MFRYLTSYRFYILAKAGFCAAYLWFIRDFFLIHVALWNQMQPLLPDGSGIVIFDIAWLDAALRGIFGLLNSRAAIWAFLCASPIAAGLYFWGRYRWLQVAVGCWISLSMLSMAFLVGIFASTADVWLHYIFFTYILAALLSSSKDWALREPAFEPAKWKDDPMIISTYAWLIVFLQFTVYIFAGINKLVFGWEPWIHGTAMQNLAVDSSMHDFDRGVHIPYAISLLLSYVTLFQRLVVPFGFYYMRYRGWAVLILVTMHAGYAILMKVAIFPVIGISSLLMIIPPRKVALPLFSRFSLRQPREVKRLLQKTGAATVPQMVVFTLFSLWLLFEPLRLTDAPPTGWENKLMIVPTWRMFADGGIDAGRKWQLILQTPKGEIDATDLSLGLLPQLWRDRFYTDFVLHTLAKVDPGQPMRNPDPLLSRLVQATEKTYGERQLKAGENPAVSGARFAISESEK